MMTRPGNITISTSEHGNDGKCVRIEVRESGRRVLLVHMEHAEFGKALTGLAQCDCAIEYSNLRGAQVEGATNALP